jgi:hypothetical protein
MAALTPARPALRHAVYRRQLLVDAGLAVRPLGWPLAARSLHEHRPVAGQVSLIHVLDLPVVPSPTT